ncbi:hypothetical protein [uncultured Corynebacterium sp.]|uniref:hypothetical protein n=1 Tax=uncultured Corynebacterium sp. TaxID=159447 RepID=UPI0025FDA6B5|nr:hypothetical protein [uncultured Corynebacterium sp.]
MPSSSPESHLAVDPASLAASASVLRGLASATPAASPTMLDDVPVAASSAGGGVAAFFAALGSALVAQSGRVGALAVYADGAAEALGWLTDAVADHEEVASGRFGREAEVLA